MKTTIKYIIAGIPIIAISMCFNREKYSAASKETSAAIAADTIVAIDSVETPGIAQTDSLPKRMPLTLIIKNLASPSAPVYATFYQIRHKFLSPIDVLKGYRLIPHGNVLTAQITDLGYGELAIATYQDVNSDGKCNRSLIGIPKEPYGFSNNYRPTIKAPRFCDCSFAYNARADTLTIAMIR